MRASKIVDRAEVLQWFAEGRTYEWMQQTYLDKYNIETSPSYWANFRLRQGLPKRLDHDESLIPWKVLAKHRWLYPLQMLRVEARSRRGDQLRDRDPERLASWHQFLVDENVVVHYDPDLPDGFVYVPRLPSDTDIIRRPAAKPRRATSSTG